MNKNKVIPFTCWLILFALLTACVDLEYSDEEFSGSENMPYNAALATVIQPGEKAGEAIIKNDTQGTAYVVNPEALTKVKANVQGQRIFYRYVSAESPLGPQDSKKPYIFITDVQPILTKAVDVLKAEEEDIYGSDVINYLSHALSKTHLTLQFQIYVSGSGIKHRISLVMREGAVPDANGMLAVELRHNAEGDRAEEISLPGYVSFPLSSVPGYEEGTLKGFIMTYRSIGNGESTVVIGNNNSKSVTFPFTREVMHHTNIK